MNRRSIPPRGYDAVHTASSVRTLACRPTRPDLVARRGIPSGPSAAERSAARRVQIARAATSIRRAA